MVYYQKMTPEGYQEIKDEIARLKKDRPRRIKILQEARSMGDLSENSEYTTAKMELGHLQSRLRYLDKQLRYSEIIQKDESGTIKLIREYHAILMKITRCTEKAINYMSLISTEVIENVVNKK